MTRDDRPDTVRPTVLDRALGWLAPERALRRLHARASLGAAFRAFEGAGQTRRLAGWRGTTQGPASASRFALGTLRARARDLSSNNAWAGKAVRVKTTRVIGTGIVPTAEAERDADAARALELWQAHAEQAEFDPGGMLNVYAMQAIAVREMIDAGEALVVRRWVTREEQRRRGLELPYQASVLEPDYLDTTREGATASGGWIVQGVEFDASGARVAYWLFDHHPGESSWLTPSTSFVSRRVPARDVIHLFRVDRAGQVRGIPAGAPVIVAARELDDYQDAEIVRARVASCFTAFLYTPDGADPMGLPLSGGAGGEGSESSSVQDVGKLGPGAIKLLPPGHDVRLAVPPVTSAYEAFVRVNLRQIAAGYVVSYESLSGDLSNTSYASGRMGWLDFAAEVRDLQSLTVIPILCARLWRWHREALELEGLTTDRVVARWTAPQRPMVAPLEETRADVLSVQAGFRSLQDVQRARGFDPATVRRELEQDRDAFDELGLEPEPFRLPPGSPPPAGSDPDRDEDEDPDAGGR